MNSLKAQSTQDLSYWLKEKQVVLSPCFALYMYSSYVEADTHCRSHQLPAEQCNL